MMEESKDKELLKNGIQTFKGDLEKIDRELVKQNVQNLRKRNLTKNFDSMCDIMSTQIGLKEAQIAELSENLKDVEEEFSYETFGESDDK